MTEATATTTEATKPRRAKRAKKGSGCVYNRPRTAMLWLKYVDGDGKVIQESSERSNLLEAQAMLRKRLARITLGERVQPKNEKLTVGDLYQDYLSRCRVDGKKDVEHLESRWRNHLAPVFGRIKAADADGSLFTSYAEKRQKEGAANSTINRELAIVQAALYLAEKRKKIRHVSSFERLVEADPRQGFLRDSEYDALAAECAKEGLWLRTMFEIGSFLGWRKGDLIGSWRGKGKDRSGLRVGQVNLVDCTVRLEGSQTKNGKPRQVNFVRGGTLYNLLAACIAGKTKDTAVFTRPNGEPVRDFRNVWKNVCARAGVPNLLFHDLRRTAVRNMIRDGVAQHDAMTVSGHKTPAVFERYNIDDDHRRQETAAKMEAGRAARLAQVTVQATVAQNGVQVNQMVN